MDHSSTVVRDPKVVVRCFARSRSRALLPVPKESDPDGGWAEPGSIAYRAIDKPSPVATNQEIDGTRISA